MVVINNKMSIIIEGISKSKEKSKKNGLITESNDMGGGLVEYVMKAYGESKRRGIDKAAFSHVLDVVDNMELDDIDDVGRSVTLYKVGMLHDMIEDNNVTPEEIADRLGLSDREVKLLKLVSRNVDNDDNSSYIDGIMGDEDALIVKLSDRISNLKDLVVWVRQEKGFNSSSLYTTTKYIDETTELLDKTLKKYPNLFRDGERSSIAKQYVGLKNRLIDLTRLYEKYKNDPIKESGVNERVFDTEAYSIGEEDIQRTFTVVKRIYSNHPELKKAYPTYLKRLEDTISLLEKKVLDKGFDHVKGLFDKVKFEEDDFLKLYQSYISDRLADGIKKLQNKKEPTPKDGLSLRLAKDMGLSPAEFNKVISGNDKDALIEVYNRVTSLMDEYFDVVHETLVDYAKAGKGVITYRDGKYKNPDRAVVKYLKDKGEKDETDFLDLSDILGFRGAFDTVAGSIDFAVRVIEDNNQSLFKVGSFMGKGSAFQGVNMNVNHDGLFNYEVQSVFDIVQVATDMNHDVLYKSIIKVSEEETKAIKMLVQICLGLMFDELFKFKKS